MTLIFPDSNTQDDRRLRQFRPVLKRELQEGVAAVQVDLVADVSPVVLDRARANAQLRGDLSARLVCGDETQDAPLRLRQLAETRLLSGERSGARAPAESRWVETAGLM